MGRFEIGLRDNGTNGTGLLMMAAKGKANALTS
jgi:hypothetical protein